VQPFLLLVLFFNKHVANPNNSFCALRDGLDAGDYTRFPAVTYGTVLETRIQNIVNEFSEYGAAVDDIEALLGGPMVSRTASGLNDVGYNIYPGNYQKSITANLPTGTIPNSIIQVNPNGTSIGYWRVGPITSPYGRFARAFDFDSDFNQMTFETTGFSGNVSLTLTYYDDIVGEFQLFTMSDQVQQSMMTIQTTGSDTWKQLVTSFTNFVPGTSIYLSQTDAYNYRFHMLELSLE